MICWLCGGPMREVAQATIPTYKGYWTCPTCEVESCMPGKVRKPFKSGWRYKAKMSTYLYWDGKGGGDDHYTEVVTIDHGDGVARYL